MNIFLSAVSKQFQECRDRLASDLRAVGAVVKMQEDFTQHGRSLLEKLEEYIAGCDRVVALVGDAYGLEPPAGALPPGAPRRSYTQWEYFFAQGERLDGSHAAPKDVYVYFATPDFLAQSPVRESPEETRLQEGFIAAIRATGKGSGAFGSLHELRAAVLREGLRLPKRRTPRPAPDRGTKNRNLARRRTEIVDDLVAGFDVFLSHAHDDAKVVEQLGKKLEDRARLRVWLDKWILIPGEHWQQQMARGLDQAKTCAICISAQTPTGWFREEIERALNRQTKDPTFRVIPVILPNGDRTIIDNFLELRTWVDFKAGIDDGYAIHVLISGIQGLPPGKYPPDENPYRSDLDTVREKLRKIRNLREEQLIDDNVALEYQRRVLDEIIGR